MRVPLVGTPQAPQTGRTFSPLDSTTYDKVARANERIGGAVEGIGIQGADLATRIKSAIDGGTRANAEAERHVALAAAMDQFTDGNNPQNGDPSSFLPRWKEMQQTIVEGQNSKPAIQGMGFREKMRYQTELKQWQAQATQSVGHFATERGLQIAEASYVNSSEQLLYTGKEEEAVDKMKEGMAKGAVSPLIGEKFVREAPIKNQFNQASILGQEDPIAAEKALQDNKNYPLVMGHTRTQLRMQIHREAQIQLQANLRDVLDKVDENPNDPSTQAMVSDMEARGQITPQAKEHIFARIAQTNLKENRAQADILSMQAHDHDFTVDADPDGTARQMKDAIAGLPPALRKPVWDQIDNRLAAAKRAGAAQEKPIEKDVFGRGKEAFNQGMFRPATVHDITEEVPAKGWFGSTTKKVVGQEAKSPEPDNQWEHMVGDRERAATQLNYARWQDKMRGFFKDNPDATSEQAETYSQKLMAPHIEAQVRQAINPAAPKPNTSKAIYDTLKTGEKFWFEGRELTKK